MKLGYSVVLTSFTASQDDGDHQFMMFSATFPKEARELARKYLADDHVRIRVGRPGSAHINVRQDVRESYYKLKPCC